MFLDVKLYFYENRSNLACKVYFIMGVVRSKNLIEYVEVDSLGETLLFNRSKSDNK